MSNRSNIATGNVVNQCSPLFICLVVGLCPAIRSPQVLAEDSQPLTILAVGDSITAGGGAGGGYYRHVLNELLKQSKRAFRFIGPKVDQLGLAHAGYSGWNSGQIRNVIKELYREHQANIVLLHMGHNHFSDRQPVRQIIADTEAVVSEILSQNPQATVFVAQVVPAGKLPKYAYIPELNIELKRWFEARADKHSRVILVDQAMGFDWHVDTVQDKVHPNQLGSAKMGRAWFQAIEQWQSEVQIDK